MVLLLLSLLRTHLVQINTHMRRTKYIFFKHTLTIYNKPNLHRIQIENEYYTTYETHSKSMNVKQSE